MLRSSIKPLVSPLNSYKASLLFTPRVSAPQLFRSKLSTMSAPQTTQIEIVQEGDGKTFPKAGDLVTIHYTGTLENGKKFDSSRDRGKPFQCTIGVGQVIVGWDTGIPKLSVGSRANLTIPGHEAYGPRGFPGLIPPNATLLFDVELIGVN